MDTEPDAGSSPKEDSSISSHTDIKSGKGRSAGSSRSAVAPKERRLAATSETSNDQEEKGNEARAIKMGTKSPLRKVKDAISSGEQESSRQPPASVPEKSVKNEDEPTPIQARRRGWWQRISS